MNFLIPDNMPDKKLTDVTDNNVGKMTDNEVIKALECCISKEKGSCKKLKCPMINECRTDIKSAEKYALSLINRLKAENERLKEKQEKCFYCTEQANKKIGEIKAEAYKEFAEDIQGEIDDAIHSNYNVKAEVNKNKKRKTKDKEKFLEYIDGKITALSGINSYIDNLLKEKVGEDK